MRTGKPVWPCSEAKQLNVLTSTISARGAHSYSSRSFAGAEGDLGLQNTPPPYVIIKQNKQKTGPVCVSCCQLSCLTLAAVWVLVRSLYLCTVAHAAPPEQSVSTAAASNRSHKRLTTQSCLQQHMLHILTAHTPGHNHPPWP